MVGVYDSRGEEVGEGVDEPSRSGRCGALGKRKRELADLGFRRHIDEEFVRGWRLDGRILWGNSGDFGEDAFVEGVHFEEDLNGRRFF